jgi:hypothetical protein
MPNVLIHKANKLKPQTRAAVEAELGRALLDDEEVSIMALTEHDAPVGEARERAAKRLKTHLSRVNGGKGKASDQETEKLLNEALEKTRSGYRDRK